MPEQYYREVRYPDRRELWLDVAARENRLIICACKRCRRVARYLAADLLPILGPAHRAMTAAPFPCRCRECNGISVECIVPPASDYGLVDVRRPAGIRQTQLWRTVKLGDEVENKLHQLRDLSDPASILVKGKGTPRQRGGDGGGS